MWYVNWQETKQRPNHLAKKFGDATATIQTTLPHQNFGHALALVVPIVWQGKLEHKPNSPLISGYC